MTALIALLLLFTQSLDLREAIRNGNFDAAQAAIKAGADVNSYDAIGATPLHDAVWSGRADLTTLLLNAHAQVNTKHREAGSTPLHYAVMKNNRELTELLLTHGADPKLVNVTQATPLHSAAARGYTEIVKLLLDHGSDVNAKDNTGSTPLNEAAWQGHTETAELLIARGATVDNPNTLTGDTRSTPLPSKAIAN